MPDVANDSATHSSTPWEIRTARRPKSTTRMRSRRPARNSALTKAKGGDVGGQVEGSSESPRSAQHQHQLRCSQPRAMRLHPSRQWTGLPAPAPTPRALRPQRVERLVIFGEIVTTERLGDKEPSRRIRDL